MSIAMQYHWALVWTAMILFMVKVQWVFAAGPKAGQEGAIPGKPPAEMDHQNFVFRAWRTHQNTVENLGAMLGTIVLAIFVGVSPDFAAWCVGVMFFARLIHMVLYYGIATNKNPSPRSYFFMIAWVANLVLLIGAMVRLL
ncbi:hypothetical protein CWI84_04405 [Idiomarina tyrosinivorans]|uniref:MAPEG family protein n=1 Tax=Idiomarina tyrosinivorans TaxID=1445662 RepID=A0A432ZSL2_9GAMM|nr:MAPEG family protein [Idiomarina tyrosinivorans]RUO80831.1 hypothetical protein CWI84_04405 [Idiomarina tyrosinivorans]